MAFNDPIISARFIKPKSTEGMTDMKSLVEMAVTRPDISTVVSYAFGTKFLMQYLTEGSGRLKTIQMSNEEYQWPLFGEITKAIAITGPVMPAAQPGINFTDFTVPMAEKWYGLGDLIKFNSNTIARIQQEPYMDGANWIYTMRIDDNDPNAFLQPMDIRVGSRTSCIGNAFEEYSEGGHSHEVGPMWFKNHFTISRGEYSITGSALTEKICLDIKKKSGKSGQYWLYHKEYQNMLRWEQEAELMLWYGRYNKNAAGLINLPGQNGRPVKTGAGLLQQIEGSNTREYTRLTLKFLREFLNDMQYQAREAENSQLTLVTGMGGMQEFDRVISQEAANYNLVDSTFVHKLSGENLGFGANFRRYVGLLGTTINVIYNPMWDNRNIHTRLDPESGLPTESFRMVALDFGDYDGESNISLVSKSGDGYNRSKIMWYTAGAHVPHGAPESSIRSHAKDGWALHWLSERGIKVKNPLSCGQLIRRFADV